MPKITANHEIDITPERFLKACTDMELFELDLLLQSPRFANRISKLTNDLKQENAESPALPSPNN
ncbi:hypothetical protein EOD41_10885 [Mucilaginibacter limnophilus]|uniref:Uncharacterized protein n=1 Tax=Mucilaginibacter limnophilus TaxID=1932778 RepID=A0A437MU01_9SPHI|nr:hypothetical protein [Mucilaginibacter limnophilus]RVU01111.1 hypothetical protein EOD41_10885 [Mucilaginibacter limnophilus]